MTEIGSSIAELKIIHDGEAWHGPSLKETLQGVTAAQASAKPHPDAHSIWEYTLHLAAWENVFLQRLQGKPVTEPEEGDFPAISEKTDAAWRQTLAHLDDVHQRLVENISRLTEDRLDEIVAGKDYSIRYLLRGVIRHHVYHAGQIALLKKFHGISAQNLKPVPMPDSTHERQWLATHTREYIGQWVALDGDRLIAASPNHDEVWAAAEADGAYLPLFTFVEDPDKHDIGL